MYNGLSFTEGEEESNYPSDTERTGVPERPPRLPEPGPGPRLGGCSYWEARTAPKAEGVLQPRDSGFRSVLRTKKAEPQQTRGMRQGGRRTHQRGASPRRSTLISRQEMPVRPLKGLKDSH